MSATTLSIEELTIPENLDGPDAAAFVDMVTVRNAIEAAILGTDALACAALELLAIYRNQAFDPKRIFVARFDGRVVGRAIFSWSIAEGTAANWLAAEVVEEFRGRGVGSALYRTIEEIAMASGRPTMQVETLHTATPGGRRLPSPTGFGDLPAADPGARFLLQRGYRLEQIERVSFLDLPIDPAATRAAMQAASAAAGAEYSLMHWAGRTPADRVPDVAVLRARMSTDAPFAGLDMDSEPWDAARVQNDDDTAAAGGATRLVVAALHRPSDRLVGFNELSVPADRSRAVSQGDTLVLSEHRGHRLGMLLKLSNLLALQELSPLPPVVCTFNAEENRPMLDVNEAIGFRAAGNAGCWRRDS